MIGPGVNQDIFGNVNQGNNMIGPGVNQDIFGNVNQGNNLGNNMIN
jgi:hypothetical protein